MLFVDCDHYDMNEKMDKRGLSLSLLALENIMQYIYEINKGFRSPATHIPYEQSKFTNYLKNYLYQHNQTIFLGALSPFRDHLEISTKTARLLQWAFNSKNSVLPKITVGIHGYSKVKLMKLQQLTICAYQVQPKEVGFIKKIHIQCNVLGDEIRVYLSNLYIKYEEKVRYTGQIQQILKDQYLLLSKNAKYIHTLKSLRDSFLQQKQEYMTTEFDAVKYCVKSNEIRELYLIRSFSQVGGEAFKHQQFLKESLIKKVKDINQCLAHFTEIKLKFKELIDAQIENYKSLLKVNHFHAIEEISISFIDYLRWSQDNIIRSCEASDSFRMDLWMEEASTKVFSFLEHVIKQLDASNMKKDQKKSKIVQRIPSYIALRSLKSIMVYQNDLNLLNMNQIVNAQEDEKWKKPQHLNVLELPSVSLHNAKLLQFQFQRDQHGKYIPTSQSNQSFQPVLKEEKQSSVMSAYQSLLSITANSKEASDKMIKKRLIKKASNSFTQSSLQGESVPSPNGKVKNKSLFSFNQFANEKNTPNVKSHFNQTVEKIDRSQDHVQDFNSSESMVRSPSEKKSQETLKKEKIRKMTSLDEEKQSYIKMRNNDEDIEEEEGEAEVDKQQITKQRYSINDLYRIDHQLKEKKAKLRELHESMVQKAEEESSSYLHAKEINEQTITFASLNQDIATLPKSAFASKRPSIIDRSYLSKHRLSIPANINVLKPESNQFESHLNDKIEDHRQSVAGELLAFTKKQPPLLELQVRKNSIKLKSKIHLDESATDILESLEQISMAKNNPNTIEQKPQLKRTLLLLDQISKQPNFKEFPRNLRKSVGNLPSSNLHNINNSNNEQEIEEPIIFRPKVGSMNLSLRYLSYQSIKNDSYAQPSIHLVNGSIKDLENQSSAQLIFSKKNIQVPQQGQEQSSDESQNFILSSKEQKPLQKEKKKMTSSHSFFYSTPDNQVDKKEFHLPKMAVFNPTISQNNDKNTFDISTLKKLKKKNRSLQGNIKQILLSSSVNNINNISNK